MKKLRYALLMIFILLASNYIFAATNPCWSVAISSSPSPAYPGDTVTFAATLQVKFDAVRNLRVIGVVDGVRLYDNTFASLGAGATRAINMTWPAALGEHTAYFQIDPDDTIAEVGTDNITRTTLTIGARPPATPLNIYFSEHSIFPAREISGEETLINYEIRIDEPWDSDFGFNVVFRVNGVQRGSHSYSTGGAGLSFNRSAQFTWHTECGATYEVVIDPLNAVIETNEADNSWTHAVACVEPDRPNLVIPQWLTNWTPSFLHTGDRVTINYTIDNVGDAESAAYKVGLKVGDRIVARNSHAAHPSGVTQTGTITWTVECTGPITLMADCDSEVIETNETDNTLQREDLKCAIPNLEAVRFENVSGGETEITAGSTHGYRVHFRLRDDVSASNVRVRIGVVGGAVLGEEVVPFLDLYSPSWYSVEAPGTFPAGSYTLYALIDPDNAIAENNEIDNRMELFVRVVEGSYTERRIDTPGTPGFKANYKITMHNKKSLQTATITAGSEQWIFGTLSATGIRSILRANVPVSLHEENMRTHEKRTIWEETMTLGAGESKKIKWRWSPSDTGKVRLILSINIPGGDSILSDNKDEVILTVR